MLEFTKFLKGNPLFYFGIVCLSPQLLGLKLGVFSNKKVKEKYLSHFFAEMMNDNFIQQSSNFALQQIDKDVDKTIFNKFRQHLQAKDTVYIVTASASEWIQPWAQKYNVEVIGTVLERKNNRLTGKLESINCYGEEKVRRIKKQINLQNYTEIVVYGTGKGDLAMLDLAKKSV